uniref:Uncharacterized protein n=1 Tax=Alexandrium catenella TaxID=2925 RepID=A0A7S1L019_ALECA|mmetsp:Transcript_102744/g.273246  ORF Transcript_102744/g.273246 Transcript_102744/m.273246 type:complete len:603 (+) Transcript_102744:79-1887(+)
MTSTSEEEPERRETNSRVDVQGSQDLETDSFETCGSGTKGGTVTVVHLENSVYDEVLLCPLFGNQSRRHRLLPWALLVLNYMLQGIVVWFQYRHTISAQAAEAIGVYGDADSPGACIRISRVRDFLATPPDRADDRLSCMPDEVLLASNFSQLDLNGDGFWTFAEARRLSENFTASTGRPLYLDQMYVSAFGQLVPRTIDDEAGFRRRRGSLGPLDLRAEDIVNVSALSADCGLKFAVRYWFRRNASIPRAKGWGWNHTLEGIGYECIRNYTYIPEEFYTKEIASFLPQCSLLDPDLCNSALLRHPVIYNFWDGWYSSISARFKFAKILARSKGPYDVQPPEKGCAKLIDQACPALIPRSSWRYGLAQKASLCGTKSVQRDGANLLVGYAKPSEFSGTWGVTQPPFLLFLSLILLLWGMAMGIELTSVVHRWELLCLLEARDGSACLEVGEDSVQLLAITRRLRWLNLCLNLLPRSVLSLVILAAGTAFLVQVRETGDLILNSLALTFLLSVDDMLFLMFAGRRHKHLVASCRPIPVPPACLPRCRGCSQYVVFVFVVLVMAAVVASAYLGSHGSVNLGEAFSCLCDKRGPRCEEPLLLGGR